MAKIGEGTFMASMRLGLAEFRELFSLGGNVEQPVPYGTWGTMTRSEVADARRADFGQEQAAMPGNAILPTPAEVIDYPHAYQPEGQKPAMERGGDALPTPSQVLANPNAYQPEPQPGNEQHQEQGREM